VTEVCLDREVAPALREVLRIDAEVAKERVRRVAEQLQVATLVNVTVVVDPVGRHARRLESHRLREIVVLPQHVRVAGLEEHALPPG